MHDHVFIFYFPQLYLSHNGEHFLPTACVIRGVNHPALVALLTALTLPYIGLNTGVTNKTNSSSVQPLSVPVHFNCDSASK